MTMDDVFGGSEDKENPEPGEMGRAIVLFGRSWHSLAAVRSLAARGVEVISADEYRLTPSALSDSSFGSFTYPSPAEEPEQFLDALEAAIEEWRPSDGRPYVLQPVQQETFLLAEHRARFDGLIDVVMPSAQLIANVRDKGWLAHQAHELGLAVPQTRRFTERPETLADIDLPVIVKTPTGAGGIGVVLAESSQDLENAFDELSERFQEFPIIQSVAQGEDICVTAICDRGRVHSLMTYRNVHKAASSAPGSVRETVAAPEAEAATKKLLAHLNWHGVAQVDFMWDGESEPELIEINPRLFGGLFQTIASGIDFPWILFCMAAGLPLPESREAEIGVRTETPVVGLLGILRDMSKSDDKPGTLDALKAAWEQAGSGDEGDDAGLGTKIKNFLGDAKEVLSAKDRWEHIQGLLEDNEDNVSQLMLGDDPTAAVGMLYPLSIFLKHGRVTGNLLHGVPDERD